MWHDMKAVLNAVWLALVERLGRSKSYHPQPEEWDIETYDIRAVRLKLTQEWPISPDATEEWVGIVGPQRHVTIKVSQPSQARSQRGPKDTQTR